ncbi:MAG: rod shape-determining protein MreC [Chloroflexi bacterium]|nr:MAG: rod shape-determining protein MreC [Chloroflexota bacterium]HDN79448.1 rod shape-determining protein MreC [Chloroflexota bacterium]
MGRKRGDWQWFAILLTISLVGLALHQAGYVNPVEDVALRIITPFQKGASFIYSLTRDSIETIRELQDLKRENEELRHEVERLTVENVRLKELEAENRTLRRMLNFVEANPGYDYKAAQVIGRVIARDPSGFTHYFLIDAGRKDGLAPGMPVVTERGLVGRISDVYHNASRVLLITDPSSSIGAFLQSSRATGMVEGTVEGVLKMRFIPLDAPVSVGDVVLTSGLGGLLPRGLVIGQVIEIDKKDYALFQEARLQPTVDFNQLEFVLVITNFRPFSLEEGGE